MLRISYPTSMLGLSGLRRLVRNHVPTDFKGKSEVTMEVSLFSLDGLMGDLRYAVYQYVLLTAGESGT